MLCFPYIFRGALDCGATRITEEMKLACVREIAALAKAEISDEVAVGLRRPGAAFGPEYIIPKPFDSRLILRIAPAVAKAAAESGVATRPIADLDAYRAVADPVRLPDRHGDAPGVRRREVAGRRAWSMPKARTSACCAPCRSCSTKAWPGRSSSAGRP